eukprot:SAG25_NODE_2326_length_1719_cov_1.791358_1_plen_264_part_00
MRTQAGRQFVTPRTGPGEQSGRRGRERNLPSWSHHCYRSSPFSRLQGSSSPQARVASSRKRLPARPRSCPLRAAAGLTGPLDCDVPTPAQPLGAHCAHTPSPGTPSVDYLYRPSPLCMPYTGRGAAAPCCWIVADSSFANRSWSVLPSVRTPKTVRRSLTWCAVRLSHLSAMVAGAGPPEQWAPSVGPTPSGRRRRPPAAGLRLSRQIEAMANRGSNTQADSRHTQERATLRFLLSAFFCCLLPAATTSSGPVLLLLHGYCHD